MNRNLILILLDTCFFVDGYMQGGAAKYVPNITNEDSCAMHVKQEFPEVSGATWYNNTSCWAEFGEVVIHSSLHRNCRFQGTIFLLIESIKFLGHFKENKPQILI